MTYRSRGLLILDTLKTLNKIVQALENLRLASACGVCGPDQISCHPCFRDHLQLYVSCGMGISGKSRTSIHNK